MKDRTDTPSRRTTTATVLAAAAVASLLAHPGVDTKPPRNPQPRPVYVAGGVWGGG